MQRAARRRQPAGQAARRAGTVIPLPRRPRDRLAAAVVDLVAATRDIPALLLLHPSRCDAPVAEARQLAMYLMHVILSRTYSEIGHYFGRDRTTVAHACGLIEDLRDDPAFEALVVTLESQLAVLAAGDERDVQA